MQAKYFGLFLLLTAFNLYSNILLERPQELSTIEINERAKNWEAYFTWHLGNFASFTCCYANRESSFVMQLFKVPIRSYNFHYASNIKKFIGSLRQRQNKRGYYFTEPLKINNPNPQTIEFNKLCEMLKNKKFVFYTGAGISAAGNVATMNDLEISLRMKKGRKFLKTVFISPKIIASAFSDFCQSAIYELPTAAHYALHTIAQHAGISIITENVDLLQERTGSSPIHSRSDIIHSLQPHNLQEVDYIVCIGLSHDDCGFLAYYKENNRKGIIIAIDLAIPNYLSGEDYIVQEDLQIILPNLAKEIVH